MVKRLVATLCAVVMVMGLSVIGLTGCGGRENTFRLANWYDFISTAPYGRDLLREFEEYMEEKTGERWRVIEENFVSNQELYMQMVDGHREFDIIVPSDYMLERLRVENRLQRLDMSRLSEYDLTHEVDGNYQFNPEMIDVDITSRIRGGNGHYYGVPYLYGTMGIMFDNRISGLADAIAYYGWRSLWAYDAALTPTWNSQFGVARTIRPSMKSIGREAFHTARLAYHRPELLRLQDEYGLDSEEYQTFLNSLFGNTAFAGRTFQQEVNHMRTFLQRMSPNTLYEDGDDSMIAFLDGTATHSLGVEWSTSASFAMMYGVNGEHTKYFIPQEGTNLWINNLAIPRNARNTDAAYAFIRFISRPEIAQSNMAWVGSTTPIIPAVDAHYESMTASGGMFYGTDNPLSNPANAWRMQFERTMFPNRFENIMQSAAVMQHFNDRPLNDMIDAIVMGAR